MKLRFLTASFCLAGLLAMGMVALVTAQDKTKGGETVPAPGTIKFTTAPAAVQKTFLEETNNAKIELLGKGKAKERDPDEKAIFRAIVGLNGFNYDLIVAGDGHVVSKVLQPVSGEIKLDGCPPAVQKTLQFEAKGAKIEAISKVSVGKRSDYVFDVTMKNQDYQLTITDEGILMSKMLDDGSE